MDATSITFEIPGDAVPQPRARATRGGRMYTPTKNGIGTFKEAIALAAKMAAVHADLCPADEAGYAIEIECVFARPPSHLGATGWPRPSAPRWPGLRTGDNDNLEKGIWDAITKSGAVWRDDSQIVQNGLRKRYAAHGEAARTIVTVRRLPP